MTRVLIVEDEPQLLCALEINLKARKYDVVTAATGASALRTATGSPPDLVILDLGLPDMDGMEVIHGLRGWTNTPIVILSARENQTEKIRAFDAGADDYVAKPFGMGELLARIRAALRRGQPAEESTVIATAAFTVDLAAKRVKTAQGREVRLTPTEWQLLEVLSRHQGKLVTQRQLLKEVWQPAYTTEANCLRVYMAQLRRKLERDPSHPRHLITEPGLGYRLEP